MVRYNRFCSLLTSNGLKLDTTYIHMHRKSLLASLREYLNSKFITQTELPILAQFVDFIQNNPACFERKNHGHVTSSIWIVNAQKTHALLTHHKKFNLWIQLGGHNDGESNCKKVAAQEAHEESGIAGLQFIHPGIFDIDIHQIPSACAYHYDVRYLMQAPANASYQISEESHDLAWAPFDKMGEYTKQVSVLRMHEKAKNYFIF